MKEKAAIKAKKKRLKKGCGKESGTKEAAEREAAAYVAIINQLYQ